MKNNTNVTRIFNKFAKAYQNKYMNVDLYAESLDYFCDSFKTDKVKILDIGCGPGNVSQYLLSYRQDFEITGIDLAKHMIDLAKINNPHACFQVMDCRHIKKISQTFDGIICGFCIPYLDINETIKLIKDTSELINTHGVLYISCMADNYLNSGKKGPSTGGDDGLQTYYYQKSQLIDILHDYGFSIIKSYQINNPQQADTRIKDLVLIARKNQ